MPARVSTASGCPVLVTWRSRVTPAADGSTMNTATESGSTRAVTSTASATVPEGTHDLVPESVHAVAVALGHHRR